MNPYVFLVGCPRSGTTLLHRLTDAHPQLAVIHETLWIPRLFESRKGVTPDGMVTPELIPHLLADRRFPHLGIEPYELEQLLRSNGRPSYASFVTAILDLYGRKRDKPLVGDKSPSYVRSIPTLHALWPAAKFVHLIRDGRDVALSAVAWKKADKIFRHFRRWSADPWTTAAFWWERSVRLGREAGAKLPRGLYYEVSYEALVTDPESECRELCSFLELRFDEAMLRFHEGRTRPQAGSSKRRWLPPTPNLRDWRTEMPADGVERFEAAAGNLLDELGYPRATPETGPERLDEAAEARQIFQEDVVERRRPVPERWS
ncbi:MAG: sulfotransferase [Actinomycetota bacterium]|nr:sulfotransferase [Actinomycetota bacterium]MDQ2980985.1 sulfotransferase [Actinomycetota bacterium]